MKILSIIICFIIFSNLVIAVEELTQAEAKDLIDNAKEDLIELRDLEYGVMYVNDTIIAAQKKFDEVKFAEVLRNKISYSETEVKAAENYLEGVDYSSFTYSEIIPLLEEISVVKTKTYAISDKLELIQIKLKEYELLGVNTSKSNDLFLEGLKNFKSEKFEDAEKRLVEAEDLLESGKAEITIVSIATEATRGFLKKHWLKLGIIISILASLGFISYKQTRIYLNKRKLHNLKLEKEAITELIKKTQKDRYNHEKIRGNAYTIRMKVFKNRVTELEHSIPVLEEQISGKKKSKINK